MKYSREKLEAFLRSAWKFLTVPIVPAQWNWFTRQVYYAFVVGLFGFFGPAYIFYHSYITTAQEQTAAIQENTVITSQAVEEVRGLREEIQATLHYAPPETLSLFGRVFPNDLLLRKDINTVFSRNYLTDRGTLNDMVRIAIESSDRIEYVEREARERGIPEDIVFLFFHEGRFSDFAISSAKATGPCQFMKETGARYRLRVIPGVLDERRSFPHCINAALNHLRDLYNGYQTKYPAGGTNNWYLAAATYNTSKVDEAIRRTGGRSDYFAIRPFLPRQTQLYHVKIALEKELVTNYREYGISMRSIHPISTLCTLERRIDLKAVARLDHVVGDSLGFRTAGGEVDWNKFYFCNPHILLDDPKDRLPRQYYVFNLPAPEGAVLEAMPSYLDTIHVQTPRPRRRP